MITEKDVQNFIKKYIGEIPDPIDRRNVEELLRVSMQANEEVYKEFERDAFEQERKIHSNIEKGMVE